MPSRRSFLSAISAVCRIAATQGLAIAATSNRREYHVSPQGNDRNTGSPSRPLKTISAAAALAQAGDVITVHEGIYRERIAPPRGGLSDAERRKIITTELLGNAIFPDLPFERPNGTPVRIDTDYSGRKRNPASPFLGPFECPIGGRQSIRII